MSEAEHNTVLIITEKGESEVRRRCGAKARIVSSQILRNQDTYRKAVSEFPELRTLLDQVFQFAVCNVTPRKR